MIDDKVVASFVVVAMIIHRVIDGRRLLVAMGAIVVHRWIVQHFSLLELR